MYFNIQFKRRFSLIQMPLNVPNTFVQVPGTHQGLVVCNEVYMTHRLSDGNNVIGSCAKGGVIL